jgi:hypothetical protein
MEITQEEFNAYEDVRLSGVTNMLAISTVSAYSGLSRDKILSIINNYSELNKKYKN